MGGRTLLISAPVTTGWVQGNRCDNRENHLVCFQLCLCVGGREEERQYLVYIKRKLYIIGIKNALSARKKRLQPVFTIYHPEKITQPLAFEAVTQPGLKNE